MEPPPSLYFPSAGKLLLNKGSTTRPPNGIGFLRPPAENTGSALPNWARKTRIAFLRPPAENTGSALPYGARKTRIAFPAGRGEDGISRPGRGGQSTLVP
jgi:hypothetical protein